MERVGILFALIALALIGGLTHNAPSPPEARALPAADPVASEFSLAEDPAVTRCLSSVTPDGEDLPQLGDLNDLVIAVSGQVVGIRDLSFKRPVDAKFLSSRQIEARISKLVVTETSGREDAAEGDVLALLGAVEPGTDFGAVTEDALTSQVAGLYVPKTEELLVRADGELGAVELVTLAHELEHALADQALGIPLPDGRVPEGRSDSVLARQALVEGDATLTMSFYQLGALGPEAQLGLLLSPETTGAQDDLERLPDYVQRQLLYPYTAGLRYVCRLYNDGGWKAIDRAYSNPPASSAEVIYGAGAADPAPPPTLGDPGPGWRSQLDDQLGAAPLRWLLAAPGGAPGRAISRTGPALRSLASSKVELWAGPGSSAKALGVALRGDPEALCRVVGEFEEAAFPARGEVDAPDGATKPGRKDRGRFGLERYPTSAARAFSTPSIVNGLSRRGRVRYASEMPSSPPPVEKTNGISRAASASATGQLFSPPRRLTSRIAASIPPASMSSKAAATQSAIPATTCPRTSMKSSSIIAISGSSSTSRMRSDAFMPRPIAGNRRCATS